MASPAASQPPASIARRHDLDALRAVAMLLGIVLHGAMSFIPGIGTFWGVQDLQSHAAFGVLLAGIHGFRMPLFFLISGFFTAMLWRKRGLESLLFQRFKRIFVPLVIGLFTIIPATWIVGAFVRAEGGQSNTTASANADEPDLIMVAATGDAVSVKRLIEQGVDVDQQNGDGSTALHAAVFFGRAEVTELLLKAEADVEIENHNGERPTDLLFSPWGITTIIADMLRIEVEREELNRGRKRIAELFEERGIVVSEGPGDAKKLWGLVQLAMYFPLLGHLWFLWFLCWLVLGFTLCVVLVQSLGATSIPAWMSLSSWRYAWLIPLTVIPQFFMGQAGNSFGPDTSIGLLPLPTVLAYYAIFFGFGVCYFDANDSEGRVGRRWWFVLPLAVFVVFPIGLAVGAQDGIAQHAISVLCQVAYAWLVTFGMMGLFRYWLDSDNKTMRYLSDSSYWLYLAHLPLILLVQYWVRDWRVSALVKFPLVCAVTSALLLISYQLFVRYTPIGTLLNGPRRRHREVAVDALVMDAEPVGDTSAAGTDG